MSRMKFAKKIWGIHGDVDFSVLNDKEKYDNLIYEKHIKGDYYHFGESIGLEKLKNDSIGNDIMFENMRRSWLHRDFYIDGMKKGKESDFVTLPFLPKTEQPRAGLYVLLGLPGKGKTTIKNKFFNSKRSIYYNEPDSELWGNPSTLLYLLHGIGRQHGTWIIDSVKETLIQSGENLGTGGLSKESLVLLGQIATCFYRMNRQIWVTVNPIEEKVIEPWFENISTFVNGVIWIQDPIKGQYTMRFSENRIGENEWDMGRVVYDIVVDGLDGPNNIIEAVSLKMNKSQSDVSVSLYSDNNHFKRRK